MAQAPDLLTSAEVCAVLDIDRSTLSRWASSGRIAPAIKAAGVRGPFWFTREETERVQSELVAAKATADTG